MLNLLSHCIGNAEGRNKSTEGQGTTIQIHVDVGNHGEHINMPIPPYQVYQPCAGATQEERGGDIQLSQNTAYAISKKVVTFGP